MSKIPLDKRRGWVEHGEADADLVEITHGRLLSGRFSARLWVDTHQPH